MIDCFNCPITDVRLQPTVRLHCLITTVQREKWNIKQLMHQLHLRKLWWLWLVLLAHNPHSKFIIAESTKQHCYYFAGVCHCVCFQTRGSGRDIIWPADHEENGRQSPYHMQVDSPSWWMDRRRQLSQAWLIWVNNRLSLTSKNRLNFISPTDENQVVILEGELKS